MTLTFEHHPQMTDHIFETLIDLLSQASGLPRKSITSTTPLSALGIDSVDAPGLIEEISRLTGKSVTLAQLFCAETVSDLGHVLDEGHPEDLRSKSTANPSSDDDFERYINPHLTDRMRRLNLDRRYVSGSGLWLEDDQGRRVLDFTSQYGALPFGHNDPGMWNALRRVERDALPGFAQVSLLTSASSLARDLVALAPRGLSKVTFVNSGAEATEVAIKLALAKTKRSRIASTFGGFHGKTLAALSATGRDKYQKPFGLPSADYAKIPFGDLDALRDLLSKDGESLALFIVEPIQGEGGVTPAPDGYLKAAERLCRQYNVLFAIDEVQTGLGRTGQIFAAPPEVEPDILMLAKALGGGLVPMGACLCRDDVYTEDFGLNHSSTFAGGAVGSEVGKAVLARLQAENSALLGDVRHRGQLLRSGLENIQKNHPDIIAAVRGQGLMIGVEFQRLRRFDSDGLLALAADQEELAPLFAAYVLNTHNVRTAYTLNNGNVIRVQPSLTVTEAECAQFLDAFSDAVRVFATRDMAEIFAGVKGYALPPRAKTRNPIRRYRPKTIPPREDEPVFGFVYHPTDVTDFRYLDPTFSTMPDHLQDAFSTDLASLFDPFIVGESRFTSITGQTCRGVQIMIPYTAETLLSIPSAAREEIFSQTFSLAKSRGATRLGLGAFTSIISAGGLGLQDNGLTLTTGNGLTAIAGVDQLEKELSRSARRIEQCTVAVLGAGGSVGRAAALLLGSKVKQLILIGNQSKNRSSLLRLHKVVRDIAAMLLRKNHVDLPTLLGPSNSSQRGSTAPTFSSPDDLAKALINQSRVRITNDLSDLKAAEGVVVAVSAPRPFLDRDYFAEHSVVCDLSRPYAIREDDASTRNRVKVIPAGTIRMPQDSDGGPFGLPRGELYACMAETVLLSLSNLEGDFSLGRDVSQDDLETLTALISRHGFTFT